MYVWDVAWCDVMCVCLFVCMRVMFVCIYECTHVWVCECVQSCMYVLIDVC